MKNIFVLEDVELNFEVLKAYFRMVGETELTWRTTIKDAETLLLPEGAAQFDLFVFDLQLPDGSSSGLISKISTLSHAPIILYSAAANNELTESFSGISISSILHKPLELNKFRDSIKPLLTKDS